jgi:hypothetical protein
MQYDKKITLCRSHIKRRFGTKSEDNAMFYFAFEWREGAYSKVERREWCNDSIGVDAAALVLLSAQIRISARTDCEKARSICDFRTSATRDELRHLSMTTCQL